MKPRRLILIAIALVIMAWTIKSYSATLNMVTFYPAPFGYYANFHAARIILPCYNVATYKNEIHVPAGTPGCP